MGNSKSTYNNRWDVYTDKWNFGSVSQPLPTHKLRIPKRKANGRACIIFYNGTFAPIHYGHIDALCSAKKYLESNGFDVIGGYISPCWNGYCAGKMKMKKSPYISHYHRLNMINLSIAHLNWVMVDTNECFATKFYYPIHTVSQFHQRVIQETKLKKGQFDIVWLTGVDLGVPYIPPTHASFLRTICVDNRSQDTEKDVHFSQQVKQRVERKNKESDDVLPKQMYCKCDPLHLSSTKIRQLSVDGSTDELIAMFKQHDMESVAHYIINHRIYSLPKDDITDEKEDNQIIANFKQYLVQHGFFGTSKIQDVLTPQVLTEYLKKSNYLTPHETLVSFNARRAGENGFRGSSFRLYDFEIVTNEHDVEEKESVQETKDWKLFLKVNSQPLGRKDGWYGPVLFSM